MIDAVGVMQEATLQEIDVHRQWETHEQAMQRVERDLGEYLQGRARRLREKGIDAHCQVTVGEPVEEIVSYARLAGVDAIAMASHGRAGLSQLVSGSVAAQVIQRAGIPVIVVRPDGQ